VFAAILFSLVDLFSIPTSAVPFWIYLAFIWFFAAWFAKVAEKRARSEGTALGK
jgi:hypothetical protein